MPEATDLGIEKKEIEITIDENTFNKIDNLILTAKYTPPHEDISSFNIFLLFETDEFGTGVFEFQRDIDPEGNSTYKVNTERLKQDNLEGFFLNIIQSISK
jgi:hypothetical protein